MKWNTFPVDVAFTRQETPAILHLGLRRADGEPFQFQAGQFINLHFDRAGQPAHRSYSVANAPGDSDVFEIAMSPVEGGLATSALTAARPGDRLTASGPYGRFVLKDDPPCRLVLVGTGTGITPYRAMLPELAARVAGGGFRVHVLLGVWRRDETLFGADFLAAREKYGIGFTACYSRDYPDCPEPWEHRGYVQTAFDDLSLHPESDIVYLCGNPGMVDAAAEWLKDREFGTRQVRREKYVSARN
jgi:ferredoxin-NADP reductase